MNYSATGEPMFYQLAFFTPGIFPASAMSRKITLDIPKYLMYPLGLPVNWHLFFRRTVEEFLKFIQCFIIACGFKCCTFIGELCKPVLRVFFVWLLLILLPYFICDSKF